MTIEKSEIAEKLKQLKSIGSPKLKDELQGVLLKDNCLMANNLSIAMQVPITPVTDEAFVIPMNAIDLIEKLPDGPVNISCNDKNVVTVQSGKIKSKFPTLKTELFPELKVIDDSEHPDFQFPFSDIENSINKIIYACPSDSPKPIFTGILFDGSGKSMNLVACDGYRLSLIKLHTSQELNVVVPKEAMQKALAVGDSTGDFKLYKQDKRVILSVGEYTIYAKLLVGEYTNYRAAFPKDAILTTKINKKAFINCLNRSIICYSTEKGACTILESSADSQHITVGIKSKINEFSENVDTDNHIDADMRIGMNARYLLEAVKASDEESVTLQYAGEVSPFLVCDTTLRQMVLPMRL